MPGVLRGRWPASRHGSVLPAENLPGTPKRTQFCETVFRSRAVLRTACLAWRGRRAPLGISRHAFRMWTFIEHRSRRVFALPVCCNAPGGGVIYREGARGSAAGAVPELAWRGCDRVPGSGMEQVRSAAFDGRGMGREGCGEGRIAAPHIAARQPWGDLSAGALVQLSHPAAGLDMQLQGALGFTAHDLPETAETGSGRDTEGEGFHGSSFFVEPREYPDASRNIAMQQISLPQCRGVATSSCVGGG